MTDKLHIVEQDEDGMLYEVTKAYTVTIIDNSGKHTTETYTFTNKDEQQEFIDYLDTLAIEDNFRIITDEYCFNTLEYAKQEAFKFINEE